MSYFYWNFGDKLGIILDLTLATRLPNEMQERRATSSISPAQQGETSGQDGKGDFTASLTSPEVTGELVSHEALIRVAIQTDDYRHAGRITFIK